MSIFEAQYPKVLADNEDRPAELQQGVALGPPKKVPEA